MLSLVARDERDAADQEIGVEAQQLALRLGVGYLHPLNQPVCHGYQNACVCSECLTRENQPAPPAPVAQPWEPRALRAA